MTKRMEPTVADLPEHRVEVVEAGQSAADGWQPCQMDHNIKFDTRSIESYCFADWHPEVYDAFVLAAAVEYCDRGKRRQQGIWGRDIYLRVRVHNPTLWSDAGVDDVLSVLTGDKWRCEFIQRGAPVPRPRQDTRSCWQDQRHSSVSGVWRQCGICSACLLRRMSLYAAGRREACSTYVWESLAASSFREGAAAGYEGRGKAMYSHFVSGVADLDRLAKLHSSPWDRHTLNRQIKRLCRSPDLGVGGSLDETNVRSKVLRLLEQHARVAGIHGELGREFVPSPTT